MEKKGGNYNEEIKFMMDDDLIIYDDLGSSGVNEWREECLFSFIDFRYQKSLPTILTSNFSKEKIQEKFQERMYSRIFDKKNTILDFGATDWRLNPEG